MALGIAIDDTVHYVVRYRAERRRGATPAAAAELTTRSVGRPIAITSAVISLGFLIFVPYSRLYKMENKGYLG